MKIFGNIETKINPDSDNDYTRLNYIVNNIINAILLDENDNIVVDDFGNIITAGV